ncbi:MAG: RecB family exonuclease, partial [Candidatus Dormibacteraceae bacterium]
QLGGVVHEALKGAGERRQGGIKITLQLLSSLYEEAWSGVVVAEPRRFKVMHDLGWQMLQGFWQVGGLEAQPHLLEESFTVDFEGWQLGGIIDRVDRNGDGWKIIDYKTGRQPQGKKEHRDLQLAYYALGAAHMGLEPVELEFIYLRTDKRIRVSDPEKSKIEALRLGGEVAEGISAGQFQAQPERRRCRLCSYRLSCLESI